MLFRSPRSLTVSFLFRNISSFSEDWMIILAGVIDSLLVLDFIKASNIAKKAYCLHPLVQSDENLLLYADSLQNLDSRVLIAAMEYRNIANAHLSHRKITYLDEIKLSPLKAVNDMLIADKIQNRKDFEIYHKDRHERSDELDCYFRDWLRRLGILEDVYNEIKEILKNGK